MAKQKPNEPAAMIEPGQSAPAFSLTDQAGKQHRLSDYAGQWVVLYFYPKDNTPGCTTEACDFRDSDAELKALGAVVLGVSPDDEASKAKFAAKYALNFPILADLDAKVSTKYGVWQEKSMYGKTYLGVVRTTYLIDPKGKVAQRFDKVKVKGHSQAVLEALQAVKG